MGVEISILDKTLKNICLRYFYVVITIFSLFSIYYWIEDMSPFKYITTVSVGFHILLFYIPYKLEYSSIKILIPAYLVFVSLGLYPLVVLYWISGQVTVFMWYLIIPFASAIFFPMKSVVFWTTYVLILVCTVFFVPYFVPSVNNFLLTDSQPVILNIMTVLSCLGLTAYFLFYSNKVNQIKMDYLLEYRGENDEPKDVEDIAKYNELFSIIQAYFEKEKPYCDPDFTISQLAEEINSNITYISKAIKLNKDVNFSVFVNTYRIDMIKEMLDKGFQNTFTIKYIYTSAGFKQQTTFNKVFKQIEGVTPTDYIKNHHSKVQ